MSELRFFPWLQTGLSRAASVGGARPQVAASVEVGGVEHRHDVTLAGPGDVASLDASVWGVRFPAPGALDAEETFMVSIEVRPADLPWRLSPGPASNGVLDPWLVLIVVDTEVGVEVVQGVGTPLAQLVIDPSATPSAQLPDLTRRGHFAHVQSSLPADELEATPNAPGAFARLLCPRDLAANRSYLAAVVPATAAGVTAGRGLAATPPTSTALAWQLDDPSLDADGITLPIYTHWTFATGPAGDFESLTARIHGAPLGPRTGLGPMEVTDPGPSVPPANDRVVIDYRGALRAPEVTALKWPATHREPFQAALRTVLDASVDRPTVAKRTPSRYRPRRDDPVVAPPLYGEMSAGLLEVPDDDPDLRWAEQVNLNPAWRAATGLGAAAVRDRAADYVAAAWRQLGDAPAAVAAANRAVFSAMVAQRVAGSVAEAEDATVLAVTATLPMARRAGAGRGVPSGTDDPVVRRLTTASSAVGRQFRRGLDTATSERSDIRASSVSTSIATVHRAAVAGDASAAIVADFAAFTGVSDVVVDQIALSRGPEAVKQPRIDRIRPPRSRALAVGGDVAAVATEIRTQLDPSALVAGALAERVPTAKPGLLGAPAPMPLSVRLDFPDPVVTGLIARSESFVMPGLDDFENDGAALALVEQRHVAAVLAGANNELLRELLWHGVPVDLAQTPIRRYWQTSDPADRDIDPIAQWHGSLADVPNAGRGGLSVVVVRATLFRRYPTARIHLVGARWNGASLVADSGRFADPVFEGWLDDGTRYAAFDRPVDALVGDLDAKRRTTETAGWFVAFEEAPTAPRFRPQSQLAGNSAAHASTTYQPPFRGLIHAAELLGDS